MRARWYDPNIGRFVSEDPLGLGGGINPYVYANNDPVNGSDPSGADPDAGVVCWIEGNYWGCESYNDAWTSYRVLGSGTIQDAAPLQPPDPFAGDPAWGHDDPGTSPTAPEGLTSAQKPAIKPGSPYPYKRLNRCQAFLTAGFTATTLTNAWNSSMALPGHPEVGGYIYAVGSSSTLKIEQTVGGKSSLTFPYIIPGQTNLSYHTHPNFGGNWAQGPSGQDALTAMMLRIPSAIISHDSLFFISASGRATGCAR